MNVTFQTNNLNAQYNYRNNNNNTKKYANVSYNNAPSFKGIEVPTKSSLLSPFNKGMDKLTDAIAKNYTEKLYTSRFAKYLADKTEKLSSVVDHMQVLGSVIISGMYMTQTLRNQQLDEERKKTLAINQGLTFAVSTLGSYLIDGGLNKKWTDLTNKYAIDRTQDKDLLNKLTEYNEKMKGIDEKFNKKFKKRGLVDYFNDKHEVHYDPKLAKKIIGMGVLKKLLVFGTVYRFLAPVAVTPLATWISNEFLHKEGNSKKA
ncbi:hypothetical protein HDR58_03000 [bacterium]|nr:hypothetical protein [bacterium]